MGNQKCQALPYNNPDYTACHTYNDGLGEELAQYVGPGGPYRHSQTYFLLSLTRLSDNKLIVNAL